MKPSIRQKLDLLVDRLDEIDRLLADPSAANDMDQFRKLSRERAEIEPVIVVCKAKHRSPVVKRAKRKSVYIFS